jgi:hypothetical protein
MGLLLFYLFLALGVSFLCSILEAVLLSITPSFVVLKEKDEPKIGLLLKKLGSREANISERIRSEMFEHNGI